MGPHQGRRKAEDTTHVSGMSVGCRPRISCPPCAYVRGVMAFRLASSHRLMHKGLQKVPAPSYCNMVLQSRPNDGYQGET